MKTNSARSLARPLAIAGVSLLLSFAPARVLAADPTPFPPLAEPDPDHTPPKLLTRVEPPYPAGVSETIERRIYVAFHVAADGKVKHASALFNPPPAFAYAAVTAVEQWTFEPGTLSNGKPVWTQMTVELWFKPSTAAPDGPDIARAVHAAHERMTEAANRLDTDAFFADVVESDETRIIQDGKLFPTRAEAMAAVRAGSQGIAKLDRRFEDPHVAVLAPDLALLTAAGATSATLTDGREISVRFAVSLVFGRRGGRWLLLHGHYSVPNPT
jgi:ketosteroid isomerase-like protein